MRKQTISWLGVLIISVIIAGIYLAPSRNELALMQMHNSDFSDALQHYTKLYTGGDDSINVLVPLINLHVYYGDVDKAIALLDFFVEKHPRSVEGYRRLAELNKASQRFYAYCTNLEALQKLAPSAANLRELADTYDFLGRYPEEMQALARLAATPGYRPSEEDAVKLASFYRINRQFAEASVVMRNLVASKHYAVNPDTMQLAARLMLDNNEDTHAFTAATAYLKSHASETDAIELASLFRSKEHYDSAWSLLSPFFSNVDHSPDLLQEVVTLQLAQGKQKDVFDLLSKQFAKGILPPSMTVTLMDLGMKFNDFALVEGLIKTEPLDEMPEDALLRYADLAFQQHRTDLGQIIQSRLSTSYLHDAPLLAAVLNVVTHDTAASVAPLLALPQNFPPEQRRIVASIYLRYGYTPRAFALYEGVGVPEMFTTMDATQFATLYLDANQAYKGKERLVNAREKASSALQNNIDKALFLLAAGEGNDDEVQAWLKAHGTQDVYLLADAYDLASHRHREAMAVQLAQQIYKRDPKPANRLQLADALLASHRYADAMDYLEAPAEHNPSVRKMYLEAMASWIHHAGVNGISDSQRAALGGYINTVLAHNDMSLDEKRDLAYLLQETGFSDKAEAIFMNLAAGQPYGSHDVEELLGFWGNHLSPGALAWIENRARASYGADKAKWLAHLNNIGHPEIVLTVLRGVQPLTPQIADAYIDALTLRHDKTLGPILEQEIAAEEDPTRLARLAAAARGENITSVAEKGWRKLYAMDNNNLEAAKELGLLAFGGGRYTEAKPLLARYVNNNKDVPTDYRATYAYAEILQHQSKKREAQTYFVQAQQEVSDIKDKDVTSLSDEARLLYRNHQTEEAFAMYRKLLGQHPDNKNLRADFAELLIETKHYDEASQILEQ